MEDLRQALIARRDVLSAELERLTRPPESSAGVGFGKRVGDGTTEAVERLSTTATAKSISTSIADIDVALAKIEAGTYGVCDSCGEAIPEERLDAKPASSLCVDCASR